MADDLWRQAMNAKVKKNSGGRGTAEDVEPLLGAKDDESRPLSRPGQGQGEAKDRRGSSIGGLAVSSLMTKSRCQEAAKLLWIGKPYRLSSRKRNLLTIVLFPLWIAQEFHHRSHGYKKRRRSTYGSRFRSARTSQRRTSASGALHFTLLSLSILPKKTTFCCDFNHEFEVSIQLKDWLANANQSFWRRKFSWIPMQTKRRNCQSLDVIRRGSSTWCCGLNNPDQRSLKNKYMDTSGMTPEKFRHQNFFPL